LERDRVRAQLIEVEERATEAEEENKRLWVKISVAVELEELHKNREEALHERAEGAERRELLLDERFRDLGRKWLLERKEWKRQRKEWELERKMREEREQ
jgi:hypothetical protein